MTRLREYLLSPFFYGVWMGATVATLHAARTVYETHGPWATAGLCLIAILAALLLMKEARREDEASRNAERATELRAVIAYALHLHEICDGGSLLFLKLHAAGQLQGEEFFPSWPQFLADFKAKAGAP